MGERVVVGLDVAKATVDVALGPGGECWSVPNTDAGAAELVTRLRLLTPALGVCEATRGVEPAGGAAPRPPGVSVGVGRTPAGRGSVPAAPQNDHTGALPPRGTVLL